MERIEIVNLVEKIFSALEKLIPRYMADPVDRTISNGNLAVCIIDESGQIYGKIFGTDKISMRNSYRTAWTKASQTWITGYKTGDYERLVYTNQINEYQFGINRPDLIGWFGGQPITLEDGTRLAVAFSGFRGESDLEIIEKAFDLVGVKTKK